MTENFVCICDFDEYKVDEISQYIFNKLLSINNIFPGDVVIIKPNWVKESHLYRPNDWDYIVTHPVVVTSTLKAVLKLLKGEGKVVITDGPQTDSSFENIMKIMQPQEWVAMGQNAGIPVEIVDLREDEWINKGDVTVTRIKLPGDPKGSTEVNLNDDFSEFFDHQKSPRGYYGADYNIKETNAAHDGVNNLYRVSRSVIEADVFINLPKLKTHKKSGITCCLKNLVGINTYKNYLPHHSEGSVAEGGDQFPGRSIKGALEGRLMAFLKQNLLHSSMIAKIFVPIKMIGKIIFGGTEQVVRSGNWYGNDTIWRMIIDLNKVLLYANPDGTIKEDRSDNKKRYIGIVDGIVAGEGNGPMAPDRIKAGYLIIGSNPVAIDTVCAKIMGFDYKKIPSIARAYLVSKFPLCDFSPKDVRISYGDNQYSLFDFPPSLAKRFRPHFGWKGHVEADDE